MTYNVIVTQAPSPFEGEGWGEGLFRGDRERILVYVTIFYVWDFILIIQIIEKYVESFGMIRHFQKSSFGIVFERTNSECIFVGNTVFKNIFLIFIAPN